MAMQDAVILQFIFLCIFQSVINLYGKVSMYRVHILGIDKADQHPEPDTNFKE